MRKMILCGAVLAIMLAVGGTAEAAGQYRGNPYAAAAAYQYQYQMLLYQQRVYYQMLALQQQQRIAAARQQQQAALAAQYYRSLPPQQKQQIAVAQALQQQRILAALQHWHRCGAFPAGRKSNLLDDYARAWQSIRHAGPFGAVAAIPLTMIAPFALIGGIFEAFAQ